jgi:hypothetical protein
MKLVTLRTSLAPVLAALALLPSTSIAAPVADNDQFYQGSTRVFPDPQGGCNQGPCSPNAQGTVPAVTFLGYQEFLDGLEYMNAGSATNSKIWSRYMEVWTLDGKLGDNDGDAAKTAGTDETKNFPATTWASGSSRRTRRSTRPASRPSARVARSPTSSSSA